LTVANLFEHVIRTTIVNVVVRLSVRKWLIGFAQASTGHSKSAFRKVGGAGGTAGDRGERKSCAADFSPYIVSSTVVDVEIALPIGKGSVGFAESAAGHVGCALGQVSVRRALVGANRLEPELAGTWSWRGAPEREADRHEVRGAARVAEDVFNAPISVEKSHHFLLGQFAVNGHHRRHQPGHVR